MDDMFGPSLGNFDQVPGPDSQQSSGPSGSDSSDDEDFTRMSRDLSGHGDRMGVYHDSGSKKRRHSRQRASGGMSLGMKLLILAVVVIIGVFVIDALILLSAR